MLNVTLDNRFQLLVAIEDTTPISSPISYRFVSKERSIFGLRLHQQINMTTLQNYIEAFSNWNDSAFGLHTLDTSAQRQTILVRC